jgi:hypothetical protein
MDVDNSWNEWSEGVYLEAVWKVLNKSHRAFQHASHDGVMGL